MIKFGANDMDALTVLVCSSVARADSGALRYEWKSKSFQRVLITLVMLP